MLQVLYYRYYTPGTILQVLYSRYYTTGTILQVLHYRYYTPGNILQVLYYRYYTPGTILQVELYTTLHALYNGFIFSTMYYKILNLEMCCQAPNPAGTVLYCTVL